MHQSVEIVFQSSLDAKLKTRKMKFLFVILLFVSLEHVSLQQQPQGENLDDLMLKQIKELKEV